MTRTQTALDRLRRTVLWAAALVALAPSVQGAEPREEAPALPPGAGADVRAVPVPPAPERIPVIPPARLAEGEPEEIEELEGEAAAIASFERFFKDMNESVGEVLGEPPFQSFENLGARTMRVTAGRAWLAKDLRQQRRNAVALYRIWRVANRYQAVKVIIADADGVDYMIVRDTRRGLEIMVRR